VPSPADQREVVGQVIEASVADVGRAGRAQAAFPAWEATPAASARRRSTRAADLMQGRLPELVALIVREGGRTQADAVSEVREAIDFCRYYAAQAREKFSEPIPCPARPASATACRCTAAASSSASARGISRWPSSSARSPRRWPPATTVVAKPAEQTPLVAALAVELLHSAGIPAAARWPSCRAMAASVRRWSPAANAPAWPSPVRPRWRASSPARSPARTARWCR
jgi:RHH-type proline utilization regulon transcriptional repressor/proline dehydrogenase/delta 1-pyrroline-5-carboxylate dehydrogenase